MSEAALVRTILADLRKSGAFAEKLHGGAFQRRGLPDVVAVINGRALWLEVKLPGEVPTAVQQGVLWELRRAGAWAGYVTSVDQVREIVRNFPDICRKCFAPLTANECPHGCGKVVAGKWHESNGKAQSGGDSNTAGIR